MFRRATIVIALAAGALLATLATPAHAQEVGAECWSGAQGGSPKLTGTAFYTRESAQARRWTRIEYRLGGTLIGNWGNKNNVNIGVIEKDWEERLVGGELILVPVSRVRYGYESPDNRRFGTTYAVFPNVLTTTTDRYGNPNDIVKFEAIFDRSFASDPRCTVTTAPV